MYSKKAKKLTKSSPSIWHYVVSVKLTVKILSIFVAILETTNFTALLTEGAWMAVPSKSVIKLDFQVHIPWNFWNGIKKKNAQTYVA